MFVIEASVFVGSAVVFTLLYATFLKRMVKTSSDERREADLHNRENAERHNH